MTTPSTPTSPGSHSRGPLYKQGTVVSVDGNIAIVRTTLTETLTVRRDIMRSKGRLPEVGETWMLTKEFGNSWVFSLILVGGDKSNEVPQEDVTDLIGDLESLDARIITNSSDITTLDVRADAFDGKFSYLYRWAYNEGVLTNAVIYGDLMPSISRHDALQSVAVAGAGRYINLGITPGAYLFSGCKLYVSAALAGATIQIGLYRATAVNGFTPVAGATASVSAATGGLKTGTFTSGYTTVPGEYLAVGLATTAGSTVAISGIEHPILNEQVAQVADIGGTTLLSSLVMGPTSPYSSTQGRHWVSLF
jgi:hypothetical protein